MRYIFVVNPAAGKDKKALSLIPEIQKVCEKTGAECEIYISKAARELPTMWENAAKKAKKFAFTP